MLTIAEYAVLKAIAEGESVMEGTDLSIVNDLLSKGLVQMHYEASEQGKDELNEAERAKIMG